MAFQDLVGGLVSDELDRLGAQGAQEDEVGVGFGGGLWTVMRSILAVLKTEYLYTKLELGLVLCLISALETVLTRTNNP